MVTGKCIYMIEFPDYSAAYIHAVTRLLWAITCWYMYICVHVSLLILLVGGTDICLFLDIIIFMFFTSHPGDDEY